MSDSTEETKPSWHNHMAISTVIFAVCATLSTFKGGGYSTQSVVQQALASDQWGFFQAKSMKQHMYELQNQQLKLQLAALGEDNPAKKGYEERIKENAAEIARHAEEKKEIQAKALAFEAQRDSAKRHSAPFANAVLLLQIAILLSSIASLMKSRPVWLSALPIGAVGFTYFADGLLSFF